MTNELYQKIRVFAVESEFMKYKDGFLLNQPLLHTQHPMIQDMQQKLIELNKLFARSHHRQETTIMMDVAKFSQLPAWQQNISDRIQKLLPKFMQSKEYRERIESRRNYHQCPKNKTHMSYDRRRGIEFLATLVHEGEHAEQSVKENWSLRENKMIAVARVLYDSPSDYVAYKNNFSEMQARLAQARLYLEVYEHLQEDPKWNMPERESFLLSCESMREYLLGDVSQDAYKKLNERNIKQLSRSTKSYTAFQDLFPGDTPAERNRAAAQFLKEDGVREYSALHKEMLYVADALYKVITPLSVVVRHAETRALVEMQDQRRDMIRYAQTRGVPLVNAEQLKPVPDGYIYINDNSRFSSIISLAQLSNYNLALVQIPGGLCLVYDTQPCHRQYSAHSETSELDVTVQNHDTRTHISRDVINIDEHDDLSER